MPKAAHFCLKDLGVLMVVVSIHFLPVRSQDTLFSSGILWLVKLLPGYGSISGFILLCFALVWQGLGVAFGFSPKV